MPYITPDNRRALELGEKSASNIGELNYMLTATCVQYIHDTGGPSYAAYNDVVGALECAKLEFYRRMVAPYEDTKIAANGDVYPTDLFKPKPGAVEWTQKEFAPWKPMWVWYHSVIVGFCAGIFAVLLAILYRVW